MDHSINRQVSQTINILITDGSLYCKSAQRFRILTLWEYSVYHQATQRFDIGITNVSVQNRVTGTNINILIFGLHHS